MIRSTRTVEDIRDLVAITENDEDVSMTAWDDEHVHTTMGMFNILPRKMITENDDDISVTAGDNDA